MGSLTRRFRTKACVLLCVFEACGLLHGQQASSTLQQADSDYRAGVAALNSNDLKLAQQKFESVVRLEPGIEEGHGALGAVFVREGQWTAGIRELEKALAIKPGDDAAQVNLAMAYAESGANAKAVRLFAQADSAAKARNAKLPPQVLRFYAKSLAAVGNTESAIEYMKEAAAQMGQTAQLHDDLGSLYAQRQDWSHAEEEYERALRMDPDLAVAHLHLGFVLRAEQKGNPAAEWVEACKLAPNDGQIAMLAGKALGDAGQDEEAAPILERAVRLEPRSSSASYALALVYQRTDRVPAAVELLKKVVQAEPRNADALVNLGLALSQLHRAQEGLPYLQRAIALNPGSLIAHQDLAAAYIQVDRVANAITELHAALKLAPDSPKAHYDLGVAYKLQDDAADAIPQLEAAEKLDPSGFEAAYVLGQLYNQVARYDEAAQQLETSLKLHSQNGDGWSTLGNVYMKLNKLPKAASALRKAIQQLPGQSDPHLLLANVLVKQGNTDEAVQERKIAAGLMRAHMNRQRAEVATNSGKSLLAGGKIDGAIVEFRNALVFDAKYAEAHLALAEALDKQGKTQEAEAERAQAKALEQENRDSGPAH
ncbi:MAG: tetratricopeptide repeat protein [Terracidiphilus sp.]